MHHASWKTARLLTPLVLTLAASINALAFENPTSATYVEFAAGSTQLTMAGRDQLVHLLSIIQRYEWCPLAAIVAQGDADESEASDADARINLARARANAVVEELKALGAPASVIFVDPALRAMQYKGWHRMVEVDAVGRGRGYSESCPFRRDANGFYLDH